MEIPTEKKNQAVDSKSMEYANAEYPVFYRENKRLFILPEPGESGDPFLLAYPMFRESEESYATGEYLTDVLLTTATISTEASEESKIVSHNLFSGDYIVIKNTDADQQEMVTSGVNIVRLSPYVITIGVKWPGNAFSGSLTPITIVDSLSSNEEHFGNWFYDGSLNHKLRVPASTAHIVNLPNTKGVATKVADLYFKRKTNTFEYILDDYTLELLRTYWFSDAGTLVSKDPDDIPTLFVESNIGEENYEVHVFHASDSLRKMSFQRYNFPSILSLGKPPKKLVFEFEIKISGSIGDLPNLIQLSYADSDGGNKIKIKSFTNEDAADWTFYRVEITEGWNDPTAIALESHDYPALRDDITFNFHVRDLKLNIWG